MQSKRNNQQIEAEKRTNQLIQIPPANSQITPVVIHALPEVAHVGLARGRLPRAVGRAALPQRAVHGLRLGGGLGCLLGFSGGAGAAAAEEAADGVADGGADCDTTVSFVSFFLSFFFQALMV